MDGDKTYLKDFVPYHADNKARLTTEEKKVLEKVVAVAGAQDWFEIADPAMDATQERKVDRNYFYDRVFDRKDGKCISIARGLSRLDGQLKAGATNALAEEERRTYGYLLARCGIDSPNAFVPKSKSYIRNSGLFRRIVRWSCMDELASAFNSEKAIELWTKEGHPHIGLTLGRGAKCHRQETMEEFRENPFKKDLSEEEFDRIAEVFKKCINMEN